MKMRNDYQKNTIIAIYNEKEKCLLQKQLQKLQFTMKMRNVYYKNTII